VRRALGAIPYLEAKHWTHVAEPPRKKWIVLHCMEYPEKPDSAEWCARYFAGQEGEAPQASAHACVDSDSIVQCVPWGQVAWHAPGANALGIGIEHAGYAKQKLADWQDTYSRQMLDLSAWLCAQLCTKFAIPIDFVDSHELLDGYPGITLHSEVSKAFRKSTHTDPGPGFPLGDYLKVVRRYAVQVEES
jgi:N-acetyl-anhydromuramyl-L-alanine amidase AmpD